MKKLYIKTFGCQMNVYDSERMADVLAPTGYVQTDAPEDADMVILNTCHIREKASEKVFSDLGRLRTLKQRAAEQQNRQMLIAVAGCVAQAEGEEISRRAPYVDMVVGPQTYHRLPELVARADPSARKSVVDTEFPQEVKFDFLPEEAAPEDRQPFYRYRKAVTNFAAFVLFPIPEGQNFHALPTKFWPKPAGWSPAARARLRFWVRMLMPGMFRLAIMAGSGVWGGYCVNWPKLMGWIVCVIPPRILWIWMKN